ncbi:MAG: hypothetical protein VCE75_10670 [Alphaproteobacteria bacterium]
MIVTPRDTIATDVPMVTRQGILRRMVEQPIAICFAVISRGLSTNVNGANSLPS